MTLKRLLAAVMLLCLTMGLWACAEGEEATTTAALAESTTPTVQTTEPAFDGYTVKVVDEGGNPVANAFVQLCLDSCIPGLTDASGIATFNVEEANYKVSFVNMPEGYDYTSEVQEFYFEDGAKEIVITLKAVS